MSLLNRVLVMGAILSLPLVTVADKETKSIPSHIREDFATINDAIDRAEQLLQTEDYKQHSAIVYRIRTEDGMPASGKCELHNIGRFGGYIPGSFESDEIYLTMRRTHRDRIAVELRLRVVDYQQLRRKAILRAGEVNLWDDLVLERLTKSTSATIYGNVWLEDENEDVDELVIFVDQTPVGFTDRDGYFKIEDVHAGEIRVSARKPGFLSLYKSVEVEAGQSIDVELNGYLPRYAQVWWEFEPQESRTFTNRRYSGSAVFDVLKLDRVKFGSELRQVNGRSDFTIHQKEDQLLIGHFDMSGPGRPGHIRYDDRSLDQITEAPEDGYNNDRDVLKKGDVYVFQTYDGKHYAKMEVLEVTTKKPKDRE